MALACVSPIDLPHGGHLALQLGPNVMDSRSDWNPHNPSHTIKKLDEEANVEAAVAATENST